MKEELKPMLAATFSGQDVSGWMMQEKFDGIRAVWDGETLWTREGHSIEAPAWWLASLPAGIALDGELWAGRGGFSRVLSVYRRASATDGERRGLFFVAFDAPLHPGAYSERRAFIGTVGVDCAATFDCPCTEQAVEFMRCVVADGGEGIVLRDPAARYAAGRRSRSILKMKPGEGA